MISALVAITNLYFVSQVFKFNRRMSQSKLSVSPNLRSTFIKYQGSKSFLPASLEKEVDEHNDWVRSLDNTYYLSEADITDQKPRLPILEPRILEPYNSKVEEMKTLSVYLVNSGDLPSTNVKVKLLLKTYGTMNFYPKVLNESDDFDVLIDRELYFCREININVPYIGANEERRFSICTLYGQFREAELILESLKSNGFTYIKNRTIKNLLGLNPDIILHRYKMKELLTYRKLDLETVKKIYGIEDKVNN